MTLSPKARELIEASRAALRATPADRDRVEQALRVRLGEAALPPDGSGSARASHAAGWHSAVAIVSGLCVVAGVTLLALRDVPERSTERPAASPAQVATPAKPAQPPALELQPIAADAPVSAKPLEPRAPRARDRLAEEVALLSRAASELSAGRAESALAVLDEHRRKFPHGTLREERQAARARALCTRGQVRDGLAQLAQLAPSSPTAAQARQVCEEHRRRLR